MGAMTGCFCVGAISVSYVALQDVSAGEATGLHSGCADGKRHIAKCMMGVDLAT
jgi:hypothetical protein